MKKVIVSLLALSGCATSPQYENTAANLVGRSKAALVQKLGDPDFELNYSSTHPCNSLPVSRMPKSGVKFEPAPLDRLCLELLMYDVDSSIPKGVAVDLLRYDYGGLEAYSTPTTATTRVFGNTAYTTINEGGSGLRDTSCRVEFAVVQGVVHSYRLEGRGCS